MDAGSGAYGRAVSQINVTPLIDVLLVLLIIFMVITPVAPTGLNSQIPQPPKADTPTPDSALVVEVLANGSDGPVYRINQTLVPKGQLGPELRGIFRARSDKTMFVKGDRELTYSKVAEVIDLGHEAGAMSVGLMSPDPARR
ncbi:MAG TPA: biopolymer transporter ExbD [Acidobacteriaceae bacterium]|nr:biopolymer transporter ExbD [Acidobacteriaceae bacterium]